MPQNLYYSQEERLKKLFLICPIVTWKILGHSSTKTWSFQTKIDLKKLLTCLWMFLTETEAESNENLVIWVFFIIDLILNFFTEYIDSKGNNIQNLKMIGKNYLKKWFFIDFLSIIPFSLTGNPNTEYLLRLFRILKMPRLFRMVDIQRFSAWLSNRMSTNHRTKKIYKLLISHFWDLFLNLAGMSFMSYCLACLWWYYCGLIKRSKNKQSNFIDNYSLENQSVFSQALNTLYFIYTTLMGYWQGWGAWNLTILYRKRI